MICPLPFMLDRSYFLSHKGLSKCSETAREVWLEVLEECFCTASLHVTSIQEVARRKDVPLHDVLDVFSELARNQVCAVLNNGRLSPTNAEYLSHDFWQRINVHHHESHPA